MRNSNRARFTRVVVGVSALALVLGGCATTAAPVKLQTVRVSVASELGADLGAANCELRNGSGEWRVTAPGLATVSIDGEPLRIRCTSEDQRRAGDATLERQSNRGRNMLIGAGVGLLAGGAIGESQRKKDNSSKNIGDHAFSGLGLVLGLLLGAAAGTGAGAASAEAGYADSVRVTLKPVPAPTAKPVP